MIDDLPTRETADGAAELVHYLRHSYVVRSMLSALMRDWHELGDTDRLECLRDVARETRHVEVEPIVLSTLSAEAIVLVGRAASLDVRLGEAPVDACGLLADGLAYRLDSAALDIDEAQEKWDHLLPDHRLDLVRHARDLLLGTEVATTGRRAVIEAL